MKRISFLVYLLPIIVLPQQKILDSLYINSLEEVIVTATRTERQLASLPLPVTLIAKDQILKMGAIRLNEILNEQTGIITVADESGFEGVQIQGVTSDYILVLIDGVPLVGRNSGNLDVSRLAVGNIKQMEIVKGPSSSLYGSEALGGVINIITEKPKEEVLNGEVSYRYASFSTHDANIGINCQKNKFGFSFYVNALQSNGYDLTPEYEGDTVDPFRNYTLNGRVYFTFSDKLKLFSSVRYYFQEQDVDGKSTENDLNAHLRFNQKASAKLGLEYELYFTKYVADQFFVDLISDELSFESTFDQILLRPEVRGTYALTDKGDLTVGAGFNYETLNRNLFRNNVNFTSKYVYAQYDFKPLPTWNFILGGRFDNHSEYKSQLSPKLSAIYNITDEISLKGSVGYGFKAPDFRQLYLDFTNSTVGYTVVGKDVELETIQRLQENDEILSLNVDETDLGKKLKAESSVGVNMGMSYSKNRFNADVNLFRNDFTNLIDTRILARKRNGQNVFGYFNFKEVYTTGIEVNARYKLLENITISGGYQLLYAKDKERKGAVGRGEVYARDPESLQTVKLSPEDYFGLPNRSRHIANAKIFYEIPKWGTNINARINYRSKYGLFDGNGNGIIDTYDTSFVDGYALTNLTFNKTFFNKYMLQIGANNLFDYRDGKNIPNVPGIQLYGKATVQF